MPTMGPKISFMQSKETDGKGKETDGNKGKRKETGVNTRETHGKQLPLQGNGGNTREAGGKRRETWKGRRLKRSFLRFDVWDSSEIRRTVGNGRETRGNWRKPRETGGHSGDIKGNEGQTQGRQIPLQGKRGNTRETGGKLRGRVRETEGNGLRSQRNCPRGRFLHSDV